MVREKTIDERVAEQEARAAQLETSVDDTLTLVGETRRDVDTLRDLVTEARSVLTRLQTYERDLQWLREERGKAKR